MTLTMDWRTEAICDSSDSHFLLAEDLIEEGLEESIARRLQAQAEDEAKGVCQVCPIRTDCLEHALLNREEYGIWGGMTVAERMAATPQWRRMRRVQGLPVPKVIVEGELHPNPGANSKLQERYERCRAAKEILQAKPGFTLRTASLGTHTYGEFMQILDMAIANPKDTIHVLSSRLGKSHAWFTTMLREIWKAMGV